MADRRLQDVGGTPGGLAEFLIGLIMACTGAYLVTNQVYVESSYWGFFGANTFGVTLIPLLFGVGFLFWNGRSVLGWLLTLAGALFILAGILLNLRVYFRPATLFHTLVMLILLVGGLVLVARSLRPHAAGARES